MKITIGAYAIMVAAQLYDINQLTGGLFCSRGKSEKAAKSMQCICPGCPVWAEYDLNDYDYCIKGAAEK